MNIHRHASLEEWMDTYSRPPRLTPERIELAIRTKLEAAEHDVALQALGTILWHCRRERPVQERAAELRTIAAVAESAILTAQAMGRVQARQAMARAAE